MLRGYDINPYNKANAFGLVVKEYFDMTDRNVRKQLVGLNENDQQQILGALSAKLYKNIVDKVAVIDYGKIPESRGDIEQVPHFGDMLECLRTIGEIIQQYKDDPATVNIITETIEHLKEGRKVFQKGFNIKSPIVIMTYNNLALAVVSSVNLLLSTVVDFINEPSNGTFDYALDKNRLHKSKDHLLLRNLASFNESYRKGDFISVMNKVMDGQRAVDEGLVPVGEVGEVIIAGIIGTITILKMLMLVLPLLQELVYFFYSTRQKISDYFDMQAKIVTLNAERVKESTIKTKAEREKIYKRQMEVAKTFRKISNALEVKYNKGTAEAEKSISRDSKTNYKVEDVVDSKPDSSDDIF